MNARYLRYETDVNCGSDASCGSDALPTACLGQRWAEGSTALAGRPVTIESLYASKQLRPHVKGVDRSQDRRGPIQCFEQGEQPLRQTVIRYVEQIAAVRHLDRGSTLVPSLPTRKRPVALAGAILIRLTSKVQGPCHFTEEWIARRSELRSSRDMVRIARLQANEPRCRASRGS
jgi:hypothetical protein